VRYRGRSDRGRDKPKSHRPGSIGRILVDLALATGIPMQYWETAEDVLTAIEILEAKNDR